MVFKQLERLLIQNGIPISDYMEETEGSAYSACQFKLNDCHVIYRQAKLTPKKKGQFVTFWKRLNTGPIAPFHEQDAFDYYVIGVKTGEGEGVFVFSKACLLKHGTISTVQKEGKRGFRVYLPFEIALNRQAAKSQSWQRQHFFHFDKPKAMINALSLDVAI